MKKAMIQVIIPSRLLLSRKNKNTRTKIYKERFPQQENMRSQTVFSDVNDKEIFLKKRKTRKSNLRGKIKYNMELILKTFETF